MIGWILFGLVCGFLVGLFVGAVAGLFGVVHLIKKNPDTLKVSK